MFLKFPRTNPNTQHTLLARSQHTPNSQKPFPVPISVNCGSSTGSVPDTVRFLTRFGSNGSARAIHGSVSGHLVYIYITHIQHSCYIATFPAYWDTNHSAVQECCSRFETFYLAKHTGECTGRAAIPGGFSIKHNNTSSVGHNTSDSCCLCFSTLNNFPQLDEYIFRIQPSAAAC